MTPSEPKPSLPLGARARQRPGPAEASPAGRRQPGILVVDDQEHVRSVVANLLRQADFAVRTAVDGWEAIELYRLHRATIDLVLLDVRMPGLDGPATLAALRRLEPLVRCCFMSGDLGGYAEGWLRDRGAALLLKPFETAELVRVVRRLTGGIPPGRAEP